MPANPAETNYKEHAAFKAGLAAHAKGDIVKANPYDDGTDESTYWRWAWDEAQAKAQAPA